MPLLDSSRFICSCHPSVTRGVIFAAMAALPAIAQQESARIPIVWPADAPAKPPAIVTLQQLRHAVPGKAHKEFQRAEQARIAGQTEDAISHYKAAVAIDPEYIAARNNLAILYSSNDNVQLGLQELEEAIKVDPHNPMLFRNLAFCYEIVRNLNAAEHAARQAVDLDRSDGQVRMLLGLILIQQQKFTPEAVLCLERAERQFALAHLLAGRVHLGRGELEKGKSEIQEYLASGDPDNRDLAEKWLASVAPSQEALAIASVHR